MSRDKKCAKGKRLQIEVVGHYSRALSTENGKVPGRTVRATLSATKIEGKSKWMTPL
jgi:hypothetical protein